MVSTKIKQTKAVFDKIRKEIKAPYVSVNKQFLGAKGLFIIVSLEPKSKWANGYLESSNYDKFIIENNKIEDLIRIKNKTFRKQKVKDVEDVILKINKYLSQFIKK